MKQLFESAVCAFFLTAIFCMLLLSPGCALIDKRKRMIKDVAPDRGHDLLTTHIETPDHVPIPLQDLTDSKAWVNNISKTINLLHHNCSASISMLEKTFSWRVGTEGDINGTQYIYEEAAKNEEKHHNQLLAALEYYVSDCKKKHGKRKIK